MRTRGLYNGWGCMWDGHPCAYEMQLVMARWQWGHRGHDNTGDGDNTLAVMVAVGTPWP